MRPTFPPGNEEGFTLAEMLVVVAILALASGLVVGHGLPGRDAATRAALAGWVREERDAAILMARPLAIRAEGDAFLDDRGQRLQIEDARGALTFRADGTTEGGTLAGGGISVSVAPLTGVVE